MQDHLFTIWLTDKDWDGMPYLWEICIASVQVFNKKKVTIYTNHKLLDISSCNCPLIIFYNCIFFFILNQVY